MQKKTKNKQENQENHKWERSKYNKIRQILSKYFTPFYLISEIIQLR